MRRCNCCVQMLMRHPLSGQHVSINCATIYIISISVKWCPPRELIYLANKHSMSASEAKWRQAILPSCSVGAYPRSIMCCTLKGIFRIQAILLMLYTSNTLLCIRNAVSHSAFQGTDANKLLPTQSGSNSHFSPGFSIGFSYYPHLRIKA